MYTAHVPHDEKFDLVVETQGHSAGSFAFNSRNAGVIIQAMTTERARRAGIQGLAL